MRKIGLSAALVSLMVVAVAAPAAAADHGEALGPGGTVRITDEVTNATRAGVWDASGTAVALDLICPAGTSHSVFSDFTPTSYVVTKTMTCGAPDDGTFVIVGRVRLPDDPTAPAKMRWTLTSDGINSDKPLVGWGRGRVVNDPGGLVHYDLHTGVVHRSRR